MTKGVPARLAMLLLLGLGLTDARPATAGPKVYVGLFKDDAVAVVDPGERQVRARISVPKGPHGLVITPDGRKVYVSSDGASTVTVIDTARDAVTGSVEVGPTLDGRRLVRRPMGARLGVGRQRGECDRHGDRPGGRTGTRGARPQRRLHLDGRSLRRFAAAGSHRAGGARPGPVGGSRPPRARPHAAGARHEPGREVVLLHRGRRRRCAGAGHRHESRG